jgi:hypothetical protein
MKPFNTVLLSTAYLPPIQYFTKLFAYDQVFIEQHESYSKQSYRNRCMILGANGPLTISIPIKKISGTKMPIREVEIDYDTPWQKIHWKAIESAYNCSPFFIYYKDDLKGFYHNRIRYLFDFNCGLIQIISSLIEINPDIHFTEKFDINPANSHDFRNTIHPKPRMNRYDNDFTPVRYYQVFKEKTGFVPGLSIIDLLFNEGNQTIHILESCIKKEGSLSD